MIRTADATKHVSQGLTPDLRRLRKEARERFLAGRKAETQYARQLRQVPSTWAILSVAWRRMLITSPELQAELKALEALTLEQAEQFIEMLEKGAPAEFRYVK